jgi:hypothetical protein
MPPLPIYHGQMNLGDGPVVMLSETAAAAHHGMRVGEEIGPFKLVEATARELAFEWKGNTVRRNVEDLRDRSVAAPAAPVSAARTAQPAVAAAPQPAKHIDPNSSCNPNDGNAAGAVVDGYRKSVTQTPFGPICSWDPVKQ